VNLTHSWRFFRRYLVEPRVVGALTPSGRALALALCEPYRNCHRPARILEVGAGTGGITRHLAAMLKRGDRLDICEIQREFADILERDILEHPQIAPAVAEGRIRVLCQPVQQIAEEKRYDFVISGLPFTAFNLEDVEEIFEVIRRCLRPGGVFSYFEYVAMRRTSALLSVGRGRDRYRSVSAFLTQRIREHQFDRRTVLQNLPPAHARHLRFDATPARATA